MTNTKKVKDLTSNEIKKLCNLLECKEEELLKFDDLANFIFKKSESVFDSLLRILQHGCNIREATLIGILIGKNIGYSEAEEKIEQEIKEKLYNAFRGNKGLTL